MKKLLSLLLCLLFPYATGLADNYIDLRQIDWSLTREQIIAREGEPMEADGTVMTYERRFLGKKAYIGYDFQEGRLIQVLCVIMEEHAYAIDYINDYHLAKAYLYKHYGAPTLPYDESWREESKRTEFAEKKGDALELGYLSYMNIFDEDPDTRVAIITWKDDTGVNTTMYFQDKSYEGFGMVEE